MRHISLQDAMLPSPRKKETICLVCLHCAIHILIWLIFNKKKVNTSSTSKMGLSFPAGMMVDLKPGSDWAFFKPS
ncbi:hypothetical protein [Parasediminibacterium sp. JCM 36343]|uniref:hypothetical protein n=1 Tax=Parasediminibacterium sp. JCM 36343 TaxID=3374279 RepID=UPI00397D1430